MNSSDDRDQYINKRSLNLPQDDDRICSNKNKIPENHDAWSASQQQDRTKTKLQFSRFLSGTKTIDGADHVPHRNSGSKRDKTDNEHPTDESSTTGTTRMSSPSMNVLLDERSSESITTPRRLMRTMTTTTTTTTPRTGTTTCDLPPGYELNWKIDLIRIIPSHSLSSSLGAVIIRDDFHANSNTSSTSTSTSTNTDNNNKKMKKPHCRVKGLFEHGLGIQCGLKVGDWFLCSMAASTTAVSDQEIEEYTKYGPLKLATFEEIQSWSTEVPYRPLRVLRQRQQPQQQQQRRMNKEVEAGIMDTQAHRETKTIAANKNRETTSTFCSTIATTSQKRKSTGTASTVGFTTFLETTAVTKKKTVDPTCAYCGESFDNTKGLQIHQSRWCKMKPDAKNGNGNKNNNKKSECNASYNDDGIDDDDRCLNHTTMTTNISQISNTNGDNPFCRFCSHSKTASRIHHPWCSKNPFRDAERVDELLARIKHGVDNLRCNACRIEYETGKQVIKKFKNDNGIEGHNEACMIYQEQIRNEQIQRDKEEEREFRKTLAMKKKRTSASKATSSSRKREQASERKRTSNGCNSSSSSSSLSSSGSSSSSSSEEDDDDGSVFEPITKKTRRVQTLSFSKILNKQSRQLNRKTSQMEEEEEKSVARATETAIANINNGYRVKPRWVPLSHDDQDPWGEEGWQMEDALLYGPQKRGIGHLNIQPSNWYAINPFEIGSNYRLTHTTPEEGTNVLYLKRDSLGNMPWGFEVSRHDPGHACLIESVYQNSPASAATFVGIPSNEKERSSSALNVNDMIVMINGKPVFGMSEVEFNMELEMSSPKLFVGISKYKDTEIAAIKYRELEQQLLRHQDYVACDDRLIGWQEIGDGKEPTILAKALPLVATPEKFKPGLDRSEIEEYNTLSLVSTQKRTEYVTPQNERELITELSITNQGKGDGTSPIIIDSTSLSNEFPVAALRDAYAKQFKVSSSSSSSYDTAAPAPVITTDKNDDDDDDEPEAIDTETLAITTDNDNDNADAKQSKVNSSLSSSYDTAAPVPITTTDKDDDNDDEPVTTGPNPNDQYKASSTSSSNEAHLTPSLAITTDDAVTVTVADTNTGTGTGTDAKQAKISSSSSSSYDTATPVPVTTIDKVDDDDGEPVTTGTNSNDQYKASSTSASNEAPLTKTAVLDPVTTADDDDGDDDKDNDDNDGPVTNEINFNDQEVVIIPSAQYKLISSLSSNVTVDFPSPPNITTDVDTKQSTVTFLSSSSDEIDAPAPPPTTNIYGNPDGQATSAAMHSKQNDISVTSSSNDDTAVATINSDKSTNLAKSTQLAKPATIFFSRSIKCLKEHCEEGEYWKSPNEKVENQGRTLRKRRAKLTSSQATALVATINVKTKASNECHDDEISIDTGGFDCIYGEKIGNEIGLKCHQPICCTKSALTKSAPAPTGTATAEVKTNNQNDDDDANTGNSTLKVICSEPFYQVLGSYVVKKSPNTGTVGIKRKGLG